jgi:hypothetical protein
MLERPVTGNDDNLDWRIVCVEGFDRHGAVGCVGDRPLIHRGVIVRRTRGSDFVVQVGVGVRLGGNCLVRLRRGWRLFLAGRLLSFRFGEVIRGRTPLVIGPARRGRLPRGDDRARWLQCDRRAFVSSVAGEGQPAQDRDQDPQFNRNQICNFAAHLVSAFPKSALQEQYEVCSPPRSRQSKAAGRSSWSPVRVSKIRA